MDVSLQSIAHARQNDLLDLSARMAGRFSYPDSAINLFPGEHYRLLAGMVQALRPKLVVEIGTAEGLSALSLKKYLPIDGKVATFDIVPWRNYPRTCLLENDFHSDTLVQVIADLAQRETFAAYSSLLSQAELIFVDAPKDGVFEPSLLKNFETIDFAAKPIVVFDDTRLWNMLRFWREIKMPKMDLTSFGHWSGTGVCEWDR
jgi:predicted O-methyltransferase YrrM